MVTRKAWRHIWAIILISGAHEVKAEDFRRVSVRDTIGLQRFILPTQGAQLPQRYFSPDGRHFVAVTQRGVLETNRLEATVWLFDTQAVRNGLALGRARAPRALLRIAGATISSDNNEGMAVISQLQWSPDGQELRFRGRRGSSIWNVFSANVRTGALRQITPSDQNVIRFANRGSSTIYAVLAPAKRRNDPDIVVGTGRSLASILFPMSRGGLPYNDAEVWITRNGASAPVRDRTGQPVRLAHYANQPDRTVFEVSPDANHLVATRAVASYPATWVRYQPRYPFAALRPPQVNAGQLEAASGPEEYVLVDLSNGDVESVADAPIGRSLAWPDPAPNVLWSDDGRRVLLVNTFLPLDQGSPSRGVDPYVIAYDLKRHSWKEVAPYRAASVDANAQWGLEDVEWIGSRSIRVV